MPNRNDTVDAAGCSHVVGFVSCEGAAAEAGEVFTLNRWQAGATMNAAS